MTAIAAAAPVLPVAPNPASAPNAPTGDTDAREFARELQRAHEGRDKPTAPNRADGARKSGTKDGEARTEETDASPAPAAGAAKADRHAASLDLGLGQDAADTGDASEDEPPALDVSALLAGWNAAPSAPAAAPRAAAGEAAGAAAAAAAGAAAGIATASATATATATETDAPPLAAARGPGNAAEALDVAAAKAAPGEARAEPRPAAPDSANPFMLPAALPAGAAGAAGGAALAAPTNATPRPTPMAESQIGPPVGSAGFAPALGAEVSLFVKGGVQEARLHLNPAELGPITVQIKIDGDRAQVTMAAEQAPTRQALEQALPTLAGALRESGLTLTGGGVFEQPRQPRDGQPAAPEGRRADGTAEDDAPAAVGPAALAGRSARGVVDLYA